VTSDLATQQNLHDRIITAFCAHPSLWGEDDTLKSRIDVVETHGASVLLGKQFALKIKKPVLFDHMDYSTPAKRKILCETEFKLNQRTAPDLYLNTYPITRQDGQFILGGEGLAVDYALKMRRFPQGAQLDEICENQKLSETICEELTDAIVDFHNGSEIIINKTTVPDLHTVIDQNFEQLTGFCPNILDLKKCANFVSALHGQVDTLKQDLNQRFDQGWIRHGHGDLHLQNICLFEGRPLIFDAIEYEDEFAIGDILYDIAFLLMDLQEKKQPRAAHQIFNGYLRDMGWIHRSEHLTALRLLPLYLSLRAGIRCHVAANRALQQTTSEAKANFETQARRHFENAQNYLSPDPAQLIAVGGFSGSGKSTLCRAIAPQIGSAPGALILRTDEIRRQLIGWDRYNKMPETAYTPDMSEKVYQTLWQAAEIAIGAGQSVILDAVFDRIVDQQAITQKAENLGIPCKCFWLNVSEENMVQRINDRTTDASDATEEILRTQLARANLANSQWISIDGNGPISENLARLSPLI
jgi:uncharacterized protein